MNAFLRKYQITRTDYYVVAACFAFIALCGTLLYLDLTRRVQASGEQIGTITFKRNTAQRKYTEQVIWEALDNEAPLYNFDSIRTGDLSEAVIVLNDGTKIDVAENSMIVLNLSEDATDIDFAYGSIQAKREAGEGEEVAALNIRSEDKTISIDDQEGDVSLNKGEAEDLDVVVNKGEATVASSSGQSQRIGEDERATVGDSIEVQKILLRPTAPANNQKVFVQTGTVGVRFAWEPVAGNNAVTLQVAGDRGFGSIAATRTVQTNNTTVNLSEGIYYWRLSSRNPQNGQNEFST
ncbi:MAG: FecR domain-containing protein, partial [Leptospiraceae bacterium]|nr:FecR domain-containing protein [Leptospiraceae bacterium]